MRARHRVSVKIALYSDDGASVLVMYYPKGTVYGLPGGHIDRGEDADTAMARELQEELGVAIEGIQRKSFFYTSRIILGYSAVVPANFETHPSNAKREHGVWKTKDEVAALDTIASEYKEFILANWPSQR